MEVKRAAEEIRTQMGLREGRGNNCLCGMMSGTSENSAVKTPPSSLAGVPWGSLWGVNLH